MPNLQSAVTIEDLRRLARKRLPDFLFGPMDAGAGEGAGCERNVRGSRERLLVPRALVDVSHCSQATARELTPTGSNVQRPMSSAMGVSIVPRPVIGMRTMSPANRNFGGFWNAPQPVVVPVKIMSPGENSSTLLKSLINPGISTIIS